MIDWSRYSSRPTVETISSYPTILDILKDVVEEEEREQLHKMPLDRGVCSAIGYDFTRIGRYFLLKNDALGFPVLMPTSRTPYTFYRGQNHYYEPCKPSLHRFNEEDSSKEQLRSYLQTAEMMLVMRTHPVIRFIEENPIYVGRLTQIKLAIMYDGLAQHYGINTCYLDLTNDIWTAAFFAATKSNDNITYHPFTIDESTEFDCTYGVLYRRIFDCSSPEIERDLTEVMPIGLQYFNRPGRQCGFVRKMSEAEDFNTLPQWQRIFFRHENAASRLIYTLSQFGKKYMPDDVFADVVKSIINQNRVSIHSVELTKKIYFPEKGIKQLCEEVKSLGFEITPNLNSAFPLEMIQREWSLWNTGGKERYMNSILFHPVIRMEIGDKNIPSVNVEYELLQLYNRTANCMNESKSEEALRCIEGYKGIVQKMGMPFDRSLDFEMMMREVEVNRRLGRNSLGLHLCDTFLAKELTHDERARVLLVKGSIESDESHQVFSVNSISEALGEAEEAGSSELISRCYLELAKMIGIHYPALGLSLLWKARIIFEKDKDEEWTAFCKERMAMSYFLLWHRTSDKRYYDEAVRLVNKDIDREVYRHPGARAGFDRLKGLINNNLGLIQSALDFFEGIHAWSEAMRTAEFYIKTALTIGDREKAKKGAKRYEKYAEGLKDESRLAYIRSLDWDNAGASWIPETPSKLRPNLLDVLDELALDEEWFHLEKSDFRLLFPTHYQEGKFEPVMMPDGRARLYPLGLVPQRYYRGQSDKREGKACVPSLYRNLSDSQAFYERLCLMELEILLSDYPLTAIYLDGMEYNAPDGRHPLPLMVDVTALGQHYGVKTDVLDVTADKWVAAFFASTKCVDGKYIPFTEEGEGVIYVYNHLPSFSYNNERLSAVGQQPFSRPGLQAGLVYSMLPGEDFNSKARRIVFKHDPKISELIFNYCNRSKRLFPQEILEGKVDDIRQSKVHSRQALEMTRKRYYKGVPKEVILGYLKERAVEIQDACPVIFTAEEKKEYLERWEAEKDDILDTIQVRLTYTGPITKVDDR